MGEMALDMEGAKTTMNEMSMVMDGMALIMDGVALITMGSTTSIVIVTIMVQDEIMVGDEMKMHGETSSAAYFSNGYMKEVGVLFAWVLCCFKLVKFIHSCVGGLDFF